MITLTLQPNAPVLRHPWRKCIAVGRAYDLMRSDLRQHLADLQRELRFSYCRFHALFHDDMNVVRRDAEGQLVYSWRHVDEVYDFLLSIGLKPFVELNPMPAALASGDQKMFYYEMNVTPPKIYGEWSALVEAFTHHCVERYGLEEVRSWYFEVWNEPNLSGFWSGTKEEYWSLYDASALAVKKVDAALRIGGPASSKANWVADIIEHCHKNKVPLDFVSTHLYPQDEYVEFPDRVGSPHAVGEFFMDTVRSVQNVVAQSSMPDLEIHWSEWNTQSATSSESITWGDNVYVDNLYAASFIARNCAGLDDACDSLTWWVASDIFEEGQIPTRPFSCTYGLVTPHGLPKASCNAFSFLNKLRGQRLVVSSKETSPIGCGLIATRELDTVRILAWNHHSLELSEQGTWNESFLLPSFTGKNPLAVTQRIGVESGSPYEHWLALGQPTDLSPTLLAYLKQKAEPSFQILPVDVTPQGWRFQLSLAPNEVLLIEVAEAPAGAATARINAEAWADWDKKMGEQSRA
ncbi:MAG: hypothetical protein SH807_02225 [Blastochloris sp.]|nr:hypothetical protein [Blastochloris sp.]